MKRIRQTSTLIAWIGVAGLALSACTDLAYDKHYSETNTPITNEELKIVDQTSQAYIASRSDWSEINAWFEQAGLYSELERKGQRSTILVVDNDHYQASIQAMDENMQIGARSHFSDMEISPANLENGTRLMMWHGKYVNVAMDSLALAGQYIDHILFGNAAVQEIVKTNDGYIYVISGVIGTPTSIYDFINSLGEEYSLFREMVLSSGGKEFDKVNSKAIGVNNEGNTVYDTVWLYRNTFFEAKQFDMNSESLTATLLLYSNETINKALADAKARLDQWGLTREPDTLRRWMLKSAFYNKIYSAEEIMTTEENSLNSIFHMTDEPIIWRTDIQKVDVANPIQLSNGIVYKVTDVTIPLHRLIYRLKDFFYLYEYCTDQEKEAYFKMSNLTFGECATEVAAWSPLEGVWPMVEDRVFTCQKGEQSEPGFSLQFTPIMRKIDEDGQTKIQPYLIPPGRYRLAMGFTQNQGNDIIVTVSAGGQQLARSASINLGSATTYHYDRGATLSDGYPEGYTKEVRNALSHSKKNNYNTDGGQIIEEVEIPDLNGDGSAVQIMLQIDCDNWADKTKFKFHHWCLRPTSNSY